MNGELLNRSNCIDIRLKFRIVVRGRCCAFGKLVQVGGVNADTRLFQLLDKRARTRIGILTVPVRAGCRSCIERFLCFSIHALVPLITAHEPHGFSDMVGHRQVLRDFIKSLILDTDQGLFHAIDNALL